MANKKKAYFNDVKGLIKEKLDVIDMRITTDTEISEFDIELLEKYAKLEIVSTPVLFSFFTPFSNTYLTISKYCFILSLL